MRRADRLFQIVQLLRRRRTVVTARQIAEKLDISERTVYRDVRDLIAAGTPIDGEAGVGYRLQPGYDLPPLMFDREEIWALAREALIAKRRLHLTYANGKGENSERDVRPLGLFFWGKIWTLAAWCEMRTGFRNFRLDRISAATVGERFEEEPGRMLRDMLQQYGDEATRLLD